MGKEIAFALTALYETINPGPTIAFLIIARVHASRASAFAAVLGVVAANVLWVALVMTGVIKGTSVISVSFMQAVGAGCLTYLATRVLIENIASFVSDRASDESSRQQSDEVVSSYFLKGFVVHFINPVSVVYYAGSFATTVASDPSLKWLFAAIPPTLDFVFYSLLVFIKAPKFLAKWNRFICRLLGIIAAVMMLYLIARLYRQMPVDAGGHDYEIVLSGWTVLWMLLGCLMGAMAEATRLVEVRKSVDNKVLWKAVSLWQAVLGAIAGLGTIYSVLQSIDAKGISTRVAEYEIGALRICVLIFGIATVSLAYAKALGELQDLRFPPSASSNNATSRKALLTKMVQHPMWILILLLVCFSILFLSLRELGLVVKTM